MLNIESDLNSLFQLAMGTAIIKKAIHSYMGRSPVSFPGKTGLWGRMKRFFRLAGMCGCGAREGTVPTSGMAPRPPRLFPSRWSGPREKYAEYSPLRRAVR